MKMSPASLDILIKSVSMKFNAFHFEAHPSLDLPCLAEPLASNVEAHL